MINKTKEEKRGRPKKREDEQDYANNNPWEGLKTKPSAKSLTLPTSPKFESIQALIKYLENNIENTFTVLNVEYEQSSTYFPSGCFTLTIEFVSGMKIYLTWEDLDDIRWAFRKTVLREDAWSLDLESMINKIDNLEKQLKEIEDIKRFTKQWL